MSDSNTDAAGGIGLSIGQIVLEHAHFAHRADYLAQPPTALADGGLATDVQVRLFEGTLGSGEEDLGRVIAGVSVRVLTKDTNPPPLYTFDVAMTALVIADTPEPTLPPLDFVGQAGFATLFPFLREAVANLTMRGRFGPIWLRPTNIQSTVAGAIAEIRQHQGGDSGPRAIKAPGRSSSKRKNSD